MRNCPVNGLREYEPTFYRRIKDILARKEEGEKIFVYFDTEYEWYFFSRLLKMTTNFNYGSFVRSCEKYIRIIEIVSLENNNIVNLENDDCEERIIINEGVVDIWNEEYAYNFGDLRLDYRDGYSQTMTLQVCKDEYFESTNSSLYAIATNICRFVKTPRSKIHQELENILEDNNVKEIKYNFLSNQLCIVTEKILCKDDCTNELFDLGDELYIVISFIGGNIEVSFPLNMGKHKNDCLEEQKHSNCFGGILVHPHVNSASGYACFGNASDMLSQVIEEEDIYNIFYTCFLFLSSCNSDDVAGNEIIKFNKVDKYGNLISEGLTDEEYLNSIGGECAVCGNTMDESEAQYCSVCGELVCEECRFCINDEYVCTNCIDESDDFAFCRHCGYPDTVDNMYETETGNHICECCYNHLDYNTCDNCGLVFRLTDENVQHVIDGECYCSDCVENMLNDDEIMECISCGELHFVENLIKDKNGNMLCENCSSEVLKCDVCDEYDLPENMEKIKDITICKDCNAKIVSGELKLEREED